MAYKCEIGTYEVWQIDYDANKKADSISITKPDGKVCNMEFFYHIPTDFVYDEHGFENAETSGLPKIIARFCPDIQGEYFFKVFSGQHILETGKFTCKFSQNHGFVKISKIDKRYFEYSDATPYIPIGINMVYPMSYTRSDGTEFGMTTDTDTLGMRCYEKWIKNFAQCGGNYLRIWLGYEYFNVEGECVGQIRYEQFAKIDRIIALAKKYGVKLKFTLEYFRRVEPQTTLFARVYKTAEGRVCQNATEWLTDEVWQSAWRAKVKEYLRRYSNEPTVAVWEIWNEMLCFDSSAENIIKWTVDTVNFIKENAPHQLVTTSFGSLNPRSGEEWYHAHFLNELDFLQIHRYLDQGESYELRRVDPYNNTLQAVREISTGEKPAVLAETGAVNDNHSGPFRYYLSDDRGIIFADTVFPVFFAGSAGCGQIWHWDDRYVSAKNLFHMYKPFADLVKGIDPAKENFSSCDLSNDKVFCTVLKGQSITLGYIRNKQDTWYNTLRDMKEPQIIVEISLIFDCYKVCECKLIKIWDDDTVEFEMAEQTLKFQNMKYGTFFAIKKVCR